MIKFFRYIRQQLLTENKFSKYLLYAIGEIVLVVIGILIALQVNNWNQDRKERKLEERILLEIQNNLKTDMVEIVDELESFQTVIETDSMLISHFNSKGLYEDSIGALIHLAQMSPHFPPVRSGYKLLESKGIELISNDSLRIQITNLYEWEYPYYATYAKERFNAIENSIYPYWTKHFYLENYRKFPYWKRIPINYDSLLNDKEFISLLQVSLFQANTMRRKSKRLITMVEALENNISKYLESSKR